MIHRVAGTVELNVSRETMDRLQAYVSMLSSASSEQNLVAASTIPSVWHRHIFDSLQLTFLAGAVGNWLDIGSGPGLPGVPIAIATGEPVTLLEPRRLRVAFLEQVKTELNLTNITIIAGKPAALREKFDKITARAVASATQLFAMASHLSRPDTVWLLPKGRSAQKELEQARASWQGEFRLEASRTDAGASILVASDVRPRGKR